MRDGTAVGRRSGYFSGADTGSGQKGGKPTDGIAEQQPQRNRESGRSCAVTRRMWRAVCVKTVCRQLDSIALAIKAEWVHEG